MRRLDIHCYPGTQPWIDSMGPYVGGLERFWGRPWTARTEDEVVAGFEAADVQVVLSAYDIETVAGTPPCSNEYVAGVRERHPERIVQAWAAVDPRKDDAPAQAERAIRDLGMLGLQLHPSVGQFRVTDPALTPLWETVAGLGAPVIVDVGTTGMGSGLEGGFGVKIRDAHPSHVDALAADFPALTIVAAHPAWPWIEEMTAIALHKSNVFWELSGMAPKYFPDALKRDLRGRLRGKVMFGSDHPAIPYDRLFAEWADLGLPDDVLEDVFHGTAERVLGL